MNHIHIYQLIIHHWALLQMTITSLLIKQQAIINPFVRDLYSILQPEFEYSSILKADAFQD